MQKSLLHATLDTGMAGGILRAVPAPRLARNIVKCTGRFPFHFLSTLSAGMPHRSIFRCHSTKLQGDNTHTTTVLPLGLHRSNRHIHVPTAPPNTSPPIDPALVADIALFCKLPKPHHAVNIRHLWIFYALREKADMFAGNADSHRNRTRRLLQIQRTV